MELTVIVGLGAFIILGIMFALLFVDSHKEANDPITREVIARANTGTSSVVCATRTPRVRAEARVTQEKEDKT